MSPEVLEWLKVAGMVVGSSAGAAFGNSRAARRALRKMGRRLRAVERAQEAHRERLDASDAKHAEHRRAAAWAHGALALVGSALGLKFTARAAVPAHANAVKES